MNGYDRIMAAIQGAPVGKPIVSLCKSFKLYAAGVQILKL